ncbi:MAG: RICIN domain-containing protein [Saprospiraceae bacterium]
MSKIKEINGKQLHAGMLAEAEKAVAGKGDGRISEADAKNVLKHLDADPDGTAPATLQHIHDSYQLTSTARTLVANQISSLSTAQTYNGTDVPYCKEGDIYVIATTDDGHMPMPTEDVNKVDNALNCYGNGGSNGTPLQRWNNHSTNLANQWMLMANPSKPKGNWMLLSLNSGLCIDVDGPSKDAGAKVHLWSTGERDSTTWQIVSNGSVNHLWNNNKSFAWANIVNLNSQKRLECPPGDKAIQNSGDWTEEYWAFYWLKNVKPTISQSGTISSAVHPPKSKDETGSQAYSREALIPFYKVSDSLSMGQRIQQSPFYKLVRTAKWVFLTGQDNPLTAEQMKQTGSAPKISYTDKTDAGFSQSESQSFSVKVGVSIEAGENAPVGPSFKATVSTELGFTSTTQFTSSFNHTTSRTYETPIPAQTTVLLWRLDETYTLKRQDGTNVQSWLNRGKVLYPSFKSDVNNSIEDSANFSIKPISIKTDN